MARQSRGLVVLTEGVLAILCLEGVDVDRSIGGLRRDILV